MWVSCLQPLFYRWPSSTSGRSADLALSRGYAGVAGHFLFINNRMAARHKAQGQQVGVGYPRSANSLFREVNRGVEWIFSNHAVEMQGVVDECLSKGVEGNRSRERKTGGQRARWKLVIRILDIVCLVRFFRLTMLFLRFQCMHLFPQGVGPYSRCILSGFLADNPRY